MAERNGNATHRIAFRIGINIGEIIVDGDDIFGDGVNIAARVENECEPGGVCLSGSAFEQVRGKTNFVRRPWRQRTQTIDRSVRLYAVRCAFDIAAPSREVRTPASRQALDRCSTICQHERPRAGVFRRWYGGGHHHSIIAYGMAIRDRPEFVVHVQGACGQHQAGRARVGRALLAGGECPACWRAGADHRAVDRGGNGRPCLGCSV